MRELSLWCTCRRALAGRLAAWALLVVITQALAPAQTAPAFTDLAAHTVQQPAINNMVTQGIMRGVSTTQFNPDAGNTRGDFAVSVQHMFNLSKPANAVNFPDVPPSSPIYAAVEAVAPYLHRQMLCPGCALVTNFLPNIAVSRAETAVIVTGILIAQNRLSLVTATAAETSLAPLSDANALRGPARLYLATALQGGIITAASPTQLGLAAQPTRADTAVLLDGVQKKFTLPQVRP